MEAYSSLPNRSVSSAISLEDSNFLVEITCDWFMKRKKRGRYDSPEGEEDAIVPDNAERSKLLTLLSAMVSDTKAGYNISFLNVISLHLVLPSFIWFSCIVILLIHLSTTQ
jgi:hypothetical protein